MAWYDNYSWGAGLAAPHAAPGEPVTSAGVGYLWGNYGDKIKSGIGDFFSAQTQALSTMTPEQQAMYTQMLQGMSAYNPNFIGQSQYTPEVFQGGYVPTQYQGGYTPTQFTGGYTPTQYQGNQYQNQLQAALTQSLSGQPTTQIDKDTTEQYYKENIERPAIKQYEEETRPAWMQQVSNLHSSHKDEMERKGYEDLYSGLQSQRANLMYQDEQARRQLAESAAQRQLSGLGTATALSGQEQQAWATQNALNQQASNAAQQAWATQNQLGLSAEQLNQQQWATQNQLGLQANQQNQNAWQAYQNLLLGADQNALNYQTAQLQQSALPYQMMLQALGINAQENIVSPSQASELSGLLGGLGGFLGGAGQGAGGIMSMFM